jgi:hypothetical protein
VGDPVAVVFLRIDGYWYREAIQPLGVLEKPTMDCPLLWPPMAQDVMLFMSTKD